MPNDKDFTWQKIVEDYKLRKPGCVLIKTDYNLYNTVTDYARISFLETTIADHCKIYIYILKKAPADLW